ncbi:MAG TPA: type II and III secretion system protein family protein [Micropepsaceae bacterium]|nr:type II and III secretion system protein family protein [Micropepsaceae bacterium]
MKHLNSFFRRTSAGVFVVAAVAFGASALAQETSPVLDESRIIHIAATANEAPQHITLALNKAAVIELDRDARDVFVANPLIADAVVRTPRRIFIMSLKIGQTNAIFLDAQGKQIAALEIAVGSDVTNLNDQLTHELPDTKVKAQALNDNIVLSGSVNTIQEASRAQSLAERFAGTPDKVVNNLTIDQRQQVLIKVTVSEISRSISKQLGINLASGFDAGGVPIMMATDNQFSLVGRALSDISGAQIGRTCQVSSLQQICQPRPNNLQGTLKALERIGLVHTLAEPNLTAISGEAAKFLAGGEFPVPVSRDRDGNITVEFKQFGVGLSFTPIVLSKGRISLQISTEVSELTNTGAFTLAGSSVTDTSGNTFTQQGLTIPALAVRRAQTTVELPSGGSLAIGGLIQQQTKQNLDAFPGLKDLPVLGALFRSRDFQNNESELVVSVSAYLVNPVSPTQIARPDDGYVIPTDLETMLLGRVNAVYGKDTKAPEVPKNAIGYIVP